MRRSGSPEVAGTKTPGFTPPVAGTYRWVVSYSGDRNNEPAGPTRCGEASETVTLTKAQPAISTEASPETTLGGQISDSATLTDGSQPTGEIQVRRLRSRRPHLRGPPGRTPRWSTSPTETTPTTPIGSHPRRPGHTGGSRRTPVTATTTRQRRTVANSARTSSCPGRRPHTQVSTRPPRPALPPVISYTTPLTSAAAQIQRARSASASMGHSIAVATRPWPGFRSSRSRAETAITARGHSGQEPRGSTTGSSGIPAMTKQRARRADGVRRCVRDRRRLEGADSGSHGCLARREHRRLDPRHRGPRWRLETERENHLPAVRPGRHDLLATAGIRHPAADLRQRRIPISDVQSAGCGNVSLDRPVSRRFEQPRVGDRLRGPPRDRDGGAPPTGPVDFGEPGRQLRERAPGQGGRTLDLRRRDADRGRKPTGEITFVLYGPNDRACSRTPLFTTATAVAGNGTYNSEPFTPTASGHVPLGSGVLGRRQQPRRGADRLRG